MPFAAPMTKATFPAMPSLFADRDHCLLLLHDGLSHAIGATAIHREGVAGDGFIRGEEQDRIGDSSNCPKRFRTLVFIRNATCSAASSGVRVELGSTSGTCRVRCYCH
jgi:hypothetical protein